MFCATCGRELDERWKACPKCGADVTRQPEEEMDFKESLKLVCKKCGSELNEEWQACPYCGEALSDKEITDVKEEKQLNEEVNAANITQKWARALRILILVVIICFFCPTYMVSCGGQEVAQLSAADLTLGFTVAAEEVEGNLIFGLLLLLPVIAFVILLKSKTLDGKTEDGREAIRACFYACGGIMMSVLLLELYFFSSIQLKLEESMVLYEAMGACCIMRIVTIATVGIATYQASLHEPEEKDGKQLGQTKRLLRSIKNIVLPALILAAVIVAIYSRIATAYQI